MEWRHPLGRSYPDLKALLISSYTDEVIWKHYRVLPHFIKGNNHESKMKITASSLVHWVGLSVTAAGLCYVVVGMCHPLNVPASVTTLTWAIVHIFARFTGPRDYLGPRGGTASA